MKSIKSLSIGFLCFSLLASLSQAAALVTITVDSGARSLQNQLGTPLTAGNLAVNGDGAVIQVGYFQTATVGNNFGNGTFVPLTGAGSLFNVATTIGDSVANGPGNGEIFTDPLNLFAGQNGGANDALFPPAGTPLSIKIFNNTTINGSTFFGVFSNNLWKWGTPANAPAQPLINILFDSAGLVAQNSANLNAGTPGTALRTLTPNVVAPEPTSATLLMVGLVSLASRRRRVAKV